MPDVEFMNPKEANGWLSNYYVSPFVLNGHTYQTVEHYYQSQKFVGTYYEEVVLSAKSPDRAKILAQQKISRKPWPWVRELDAPINESVQKGIRPRDDWEKVKEDVMYVGLVAKFKSCQRYRDLLLATEDNPIREMSPYDYYWGNGANGTGRNRLGFLLCKLRDEIRQERKN